MITIEQVKKNVKSLNYGMECFGKAAEHYYNALASNRLVFFEVKKLRNYHVYKVYFIMEDGFPYDMQMFFRALGYRVNDKLEIYLPYNFRGVPPVENSKILSFLYNNGFITSDSYEKVKDVRVIEI